MYIHIGILYSITAHYHYYHQYLLTDASLTRGGMSGEKIQLASDG